METSYCATHELYKKVVDNNVQIQGLTGRMTGYWRSDIEGGHKTGPHRTSIKSIEEYEKTYIDPFGLNSYQTSGFKKKKGNIVAKPTMLSAKHIDNLEAVELPIIEDPEDPKTVPEVFNITKEEYDTFKKNVDGSWDENTIFDIVNKYKSKLVDNLKLLRKIQITESSEENTTYKIRIVDFVKAYNDKKKRTIDTGNVKEDSYQIFLDRIHCRVIISIYYGSKCSS